MRAKTWELIPLEKRNKILRLNSKKNIGENTNVSANYAKYRNISMKHIS